MRRSVARPVFLCAVFVLLLTGQYALAAPPQATITKLTPGAVPGAIDVSYTYGNAPNAKQVRIIISNPPNQPNTQVFPIMGVRNPVQPVLTQWPNTSVTVVVEILDAKSQLIVASPPAVGQTK